MNDHARTPAAAGVFCLYLLATILPAGYARADSAAGTAPADAAEAAGGADSGGIEEVVVTARRRVEKLQDTPITVTAVSAETLETQNVTNLADLNSFVPNMKISQDRATSSTINIYIRGVGQSDPLWGFDPGVGVYVDDVYMARPQLVPQLSNPFDMYNDMPVDRDFFHRNGYSATYTQTLTSALDLKVVGAYYQGHGRQFISFDHIDANLFEVPGEYDDHQASGEAQLSFHNDLVKAVGGLFFMDSNAGGSYNASIGTLTLLGIPQDDLYITELVTGAVRTKSYAVYGDSSWKLTDRLNLDVGLRWNEDRKTADVYQADYASIAPTQLVPGTTFFNPAEVPPGFFPFPGVVTNYTNTRAFVNVTPRVGFDYHWTEQLMGYFTYSRGFKSGGFDMRGNAAVYPETENGYNSETADNYEVGIKSTWLDNTLLLNVAVFYDPYKDVQIPIQNFVSYGGAPTNLTAVLNAGKQINQGAELQAVWRPTHALTLSFNGGYLDSYYEDWLIPCNIFTLTAGCSPGVGTINAAAENQPINAPRWTVSANALYSWDLQPGTLLARAGYDWRSFAHVATTFQGVTDQPAYGLLNAGLAFTSRSGAWRFSLDGKNLTNKYYRVAGYDFGNPPIAPQNSFIGGISQIGFYGPPRIWSFTVQYHY